MVKRLLGWIGFGMAIVSLSVWTVLTASADAPLQSDNYRFDESVIGSSGLTNSSSPNFQVGGSIGDTAVGNTASNGYQINPGSVTTNDPALAVTINTATTNFGAFSPAAAATATASFSVSDYTSYGYTVQILGNAPTNGSHSINAMGTTGSSTAGTEQFGINLVANTSPTSLGANPDHGQFGVGNASGNYGTSNVYRYVPGETIATGPKSGGVTTYTISYIVNVNSLTPGGTYTSNQTLVVIATF